MPTTDFEPRIIGFFCNWCAYRAADAAGTARLKHDGHVRVIRVMCSGRVDPQFVLRAFALGADGVLIAGCHPGECHYLTQNFKALRRFELLQHTLAGLGIDPRRLRLLWASASEGNRLAAAINAMVEELRPLGPLRWADNWRDEPDLEPALQAIAAEHAASLEVPA
jgi:F420-non-reducing hydrogenase iron-sulfur subunit